MKKITALLLSALLLLTFCACSGGNTPSEPVVSDDEGAMPTVINTDEYLLYQNIFYNEKGKDFEGKDVTKTGTFATLYDKFYDVTRYYVWGYNDQTKCCDWQWELKVDDDKNLPSNGSLVEVKGVFKGDDAALDGYWITSPEITVKKAYKGPECDVDMTAMSGTLERVQISNIQNFKEKFEGQVVSAYGRVASPATIQHPYYDGSWQQDISTKDEMPAIGTEVIVYGRVVDGLFSDCTVTATTQY